MLISLTYFALLVLYVLESPRWLLLKERTAEAQSTLYQLWSPQEAEVELDEIQNCIASEQNMGLGSWAGLFDMKVLMLNRLLVGMFLQFFQQMCGINAIIFYCSILLSGLFNGTVTLYGTLVIAVLNQCCTYAAWFTADRFGRVVLLVIGGAGMTASLAFVSGLTALGGQTGGYLALVFVCFFIVSFASSWGPIVWTSTSELFPLSFRGKAVSLTTATNWLSASFMAWLFPYLNRDTTFGLVGTWTVLSFFSLIGTCMVYLLLPEVAGLPLDQIGEAFSSHKSKLHRPTWRDAFNNLARRRGEVAASISQSTGRLAPQWHLSSFRTRV